MDPVLNSHFIRFKQQFEIDTSKGSPEEQKRREASAFERFANYVIFSSEYPDIFTANMDLLDSVCLGEYTTGIDGAGIKVNDRLVRDIEDVKSIAKDNKKIKVGVTAKR